MSVFRSTPLSELAVPVPSAVDRFSVKLLERHPFTNQIFIPMGAGATRSVETDVLPVTGKAYLVIVAKNGTGQYSRSTHLSSGEVLRWLAVISRRQTGFIDAKSLYC